MNSRTIQLEGLMDQEAKPYQGPVGQQLRGNYDPMSIYQILTNLYGQQAPKDSLLRFLQLGNARNMETGVGQDPMIMQLIQALLSQQQPSRK